MNGAKPIGPASDSPSGALDGAEAELASAPDKPGWQVALLKVWTAILAVLAGVWGAIVKARAHHKEQKAQAAASGEKVKKPFYLRAATIAAALCLVLLVGAYAWVKAPGDVTAYSDPVSAESRDANAHATAALAAGMIEDPFVDIDKRRAYVAYNLPSIPNATADVGDDTTAQDIDADPDLMQRFVLGALAAVAPDVNKVVAVQYIEHRASWMWTMEMDDFKAFMNEEITVDELDERIERKHL